MVEDAAEPSIYPPRAYRISRQLRLLLFCFVVSALAVSAFVVLFSFVWDGWLAPALDRPPYQARVEFLLPAILLIALVLALRLWDASEGRASRRPKPPR